jgi:hypothetical protein
VDNAVVVDQPVGRKEKRYECQRCIRRQGEKERTSNDHTHKDLSLMRSVKEMLAIDVIWLFERSLRREKGTLEIA